MSEAPSNEKRVPSTAEEIAAARLALAQTAGRSGPAHAPRVALWQWNLATGRVEWDAGLEALFGHVERVTDAAWREDRMHPEDRERVKVSLERATIVNHGAPWSDRYRFRRADGRYVSVTERAYIVNDAEGPRGVLGAMTPAQA
jgi:PAS domain-containing protein